ncbi:MAG: hypothetical protein ACI9XO_001225 [Paraglaciecola sp.]|jgi:hypothetical protein
MSKTENNSGKLFYFALFGIAVFILGQLFLRVGRGFIFVLPFIIVAVGVFLLAAFYKRKRNESIWKKTISGKIDAQINYCQNQIRENNLQTKTIESNIQDLRKRLQVNLEIPEKTRLQTEALITAFQKQKDLRRTKLDFFQSAIKKLKIILHNHELQTELAKKQEALKELQKNNYDSISNLEELKSDLAYQQTYVETIDELSLRMLETNSLDNAEELTLELKEMTKELREL